MNSIGKDAMNNASTTLPVAARGRNGAGESAPMAANTNVAVPPAAAVETSAVNHVARQSTSTPVSALAIPKATAKHPSELSSSAASSINRVPMPSLTAVHGASQDDPFDDPIALQLIGSIYWRKNSVMTKMNKQ